MPYIPVQANFDEETLEKRIDRLDGGINVKFVESLIGDTQSPDMINLNANDRGALTKRAGQVVEHEFSEGPIHAIYYYKNKWVVAHGTKISTWDGSPEVEIASGLTSKKGKFFTFSDYLLYMNGVQFKQWDGVSCTDAEDSAYVPTTVIGRTPSGGGTAHEEWNLLTPRFKNSFTADGTSVDYYMSDIELDAATVKAWILGVEKFENVDFTVNRFLGRITWNSPPALSGSNSVEIQAEKTYEGMADMVKGCVYVELYGGGSNDTRLFIAGHNDYKNVYRYTGLTGNTAYDFKYFPENSFNRIGSDAKMITGFSKYYSKLIPFKEDQIYSVSYSYSGGESSFPVQSLNSQMGCDMPDTIRIIGDAPVFSNTQHGVHTIVSTWLENEKNIKHLSSNIDGAEYRPGLLDENVDDLKKASSTDADGKYWICVGSKVWVWDYVLSPFPNGLTDDSLKWFPYDNINANCFITVNRDLYYGDRDAGKLVKFIPFYNDFGQEINGYVDIKLFDFDLPDWEKAILDFWMKTRSGTNTTIKLTFYSDEEVIEETEVIISESFSLDNFSLNNFSIAVYRFPITFHKRPNMKKTVHFQARIANNELNKNLSVMGIVIGYELYQKVK